MSDDSADPAAPHYRAFISYSHADRRFAGWLHRKLEAARLPGKQRLTPIFFDRAELAAGPDLSAQVREALAQSAALVVVASPAARASRWVGQEIVLFRQLHPDRPIFAALIEGEPDEAFPEAMLRSGDAAVEPLAADFRKGQDGKRLGLLKIVAGLAGQPLDRLIQRDAQTRQRRVMAVTAGAVILSLILSALLVVALRARAEAERQRGEAEGLVEFMLTDLRDKLKGVGRLDVMRSVNNQVMQRYSSQNDLTKIARDTLLRRAKLLQAMAEDELSFEGLGDQGRQKAQEAWRITHYLIESGPNDPAVLLAHAKSEYWRGYGYYSDARLEPAERRKRVAGHWQQSRTLTERLLKADPRNFEWQLEASYAEGNLCALELSEPRRPDLALPSCLRATELLEAALLQQPGNLDTALNLAMSYAWQSDAFAQSGDTARALSLREKQLELTIRLVRDFPGDKRAVEAQFLAHFGLAKQHSSSGSKPRARSHLQAARSLMGQLRSRDPENSDWSSWLRQIDTFAKTI